ncbi:MAG: DMT family transporter [Gammaproteobacteria bacterium]|nr:DMT family transporter [Gammaproteobacteria bacterium]
MNRKYGFGVMLVLIGGACLSTAGILLRNVESANGWQILFFRGIAFSITLFTILLIRYRGRTINAFRAVGIRGLWVAVILGLGSCAYVFAMLTTTVANVVFIIGAAPLLTALIGWLLLRERLTITSIVTMIIAFAGIGLMFADGINAGRWLGNSMALIVVLSFALMLILVRGAKHIDMLPATCMAGLVAASLSFFMADDLIVSSHDLLIAIFLGSVQFTGGFMLITIATRHVPAAEVALFSLSEAVLAPLWVWIGVNEVPSRLTIAGSLIVFVAVVIYCLVAIRNEKQRRSLNAANIS